MQLVNRAWNKVSEDSIINYQKKFRILLTFIRRKEVDLKKIIAKIDIKLNLSRFAYKQVPSPDEQYLLHFDGRIPDYRLTEKLNPDKTFETRKSVVRIKENDCITFT